VGLKLTLGGGAGGTRRRADSDSGEGRQEEGLTSREGLRIGERLRPCMDWNNRGKGADKEGGTGIGRA
jgi:hypothetical protein